MGVGVLDWGDLVEFSGILEKEMKNICRVLHLRHPNHCDWFIYGEIVLIFLFMDGGGLRESEGVGKRIEKEIVNGSYLTWLNILLFPPDPLDEPHMELYKSWIRVN